VVVRFIIVGAALSVGWGVLAGRALRELGWVLVPVFAAAAGLAGVIAWRLGAALGPSDPRETVKPSLGDRLPAQLNIDAVAPFLVWPMFALIGLLLAAWLDHSDEDSDDDLMADAA
jgi:hypothetical protein